MQERQIAIDVGWPPRRQASCDREADREGAAREGEADYRRCQVAAATDRHRRLGVADRCRRQVATGRQKIGVADRG